MSKAEQELAVIPLPTPAIQVLSFGVELPASIVQGPKEPDLKRPPLPCPCVITGTISIFQKSVMIWFGWGSSGCQEQQSQNYYSPATASSPSNGSSSSSSCTTTVVVGAGKDQVSEF